MSEPSIYGRGKKQILNELDELMQEQGMQVNTEVYSELKEFVKKVYIRGILIGLKSVR
ncbi:hypothetical protein [Zhenhengia yiwuensis]|uniref:hypothetical protein n=1 Tax=Zhenhengia yiwuensis TaxID=2763666 RepID=UPI002A764CC4|nr:hypothetical protein [Zhenhengia yiwuensis]MDY3366492.1 hypothetical protein [Zhenhengia yiwuensis]